MRSPSCLLLAISCCFVAACGSKPSSAPTSPTPVSVPSPQPQPAPPAVPELIITTTGLPGGTRRASYTAAIDSSGGLPPLTFSAAGLPRGLSINDSGVISGWPIFCHGTFAVSITVKDSAEHSVSRDISLRIAAAGEEFIDPAINQGVGVTIEVFSVSPSEGSAITQSRRENGDFLPGFDFTLANLCKNNRCFTFQARACNESDRDLHASFVWGANEREPFGRWSGVGGDYRLPAAACTAIAIPKEPGNFEFFVGRLQRFLIGVVTEVPTPGWKPSWPRWFKDMHYTMAN